MIEIILANAGYWFNLLIPIFIILYLVLTNKEYTWKEFFIHTFIVGIFISLTYAVFFSTTTDLIDTEYQNSKVQKFEKYEKWTELVHYTETYSCGTSKNPRTCTRNKTRREYHPEYFMLSTTNNETKYISSKQYYRAEREFSSKEVYLHRSNQVSYGDGNKFVSYPSKVIPIAMPHTFENVVAAAKDNVIHTRVSLKTIERLKKKNKLYDYPQSYEGYYGETLLNRLMNNSSSIINSSLVNKLNQMSERAGKIKQANPIIYLTNEDRDFKDVLSQHWKMGKKNDVILVLGIKKGKIEWSDVICFTNNTDFKVDMRNDFEGKAFDKNTLIHFEALIYRSYIRKPMKEFDYLKENITLEWYWQLAIFMMNLIINIFVTRYFLTNTERKWR